jgi:hypothetical protein
VAWRSGTSFDNGNTVICVLQKRASGQNTNVEIILQRKYKALLNLHESAFSLYLFIQIKIRQVNKRCKYITKEEIRKERQKPIETKEGLNR